MRDFFGIREHDYSGLTDPLVVYIGGFLHDGATSCRPLSKKLKVYGVNTLGFRDWLFVGDIEKAAETMAADIEFVKAKAEMPIKHVVLVCHSQGAIIGRDIVQNELTDVDMLFD